MSLRCGRSERLVVTTNPPQAGIVIKPRESNPDVNVRPNQLTTDEHGAAEFEVVCVECPSKALVTFTASGGYVAHRMSVTCDGGSVHAKATARIIASAKTKLTFVDAQLDALLEEIG
jgi:hypothetical protein